MGNSECQRPESHRENRGKVPPRLFWLSILFPPLGLLLVGDIVLAIWVTILLISTFGAAWIVVAPWTVWHVRTTLRRMEGAVTKAESTDQAGDNKKCPTCAEAVRLEALVCRFCGHNFDPEQVESAKAEMAARAAPRSLEELKAANLERKARSKRIAGSILIMVAGFLAVITIVAATVNPPGQKMGPLVAVMFIALFIAPLFWGGWKLRQAQRTSIKT